MNAQATTAVAAPPSASNQHPFSVTASYRRYVLAALATVYTFSYIDRQILSILLQPIKSELVLSDTAMGLLTGVTFAIFYATLGVPIAMLADRWNRRTIISLALGLWSFMTAASGLAGNFWQLALARIGVGVGEAGGSPPAYSILADYYPPEKRATALSIYSLGVPIGILLGFLIGGWINDLFGWRAAFFVVGLPGLLFAFVVRFTIKEPPRGLSENRIEVAAKSLAPPFLTVIGFIWSQKTLRHLCLGAALIAFFGNGFLIWAPAFLIRSHGLSVAATGTALALIFGLVGGGAMLYGGWAADRLARRDRRWMAWLPAIPIAFACPAAVAMLMTEETWVCLTLLAIPFVAATLYIGPSLALIQNLVTIRMRAVAGAFFLFVINLVGLGLGPLTVGVLSDLLAPTQGADSLRYALVIISFFSFWAAAHFMLAARHIAADTQRLEEAIRAEQCANGAAD